MDDELVHVSSFLSETSNAIASSFGSTKFMLEEWIILCTNDGEIV